MKKESMTITVKTICEAIGNVANEEEKTDAIRVIQVALLVKSMMVLVDAIKEKGAKSRGSAEVRELGGLFTEVRTRLTGLLPADGVKLSLGDGRTICATWNDEAVYPYVKVGYEA